VSYEIDSIGHTDCCGHARGSVSGRLPSPGLPLHRSPETGHKPDVSEGLAGRRICEKPGPLPVDGPGNCGNGPLAGCSRSFLPMVRLGSLFLQATGSGIRLHPLQPVLCRDRESGRTAPRSRDHKQPGAIQHHCRSTEECLLRLGTGAALLPVFIH